MLSLTVPEPLDTLKERVRSTEHQATAGNTQERGTKKPEPHEPRKRRRKIPKNSTTWEQGPSTVACTREYVKRPVQPYREALTRRPSTPADIHQPGPRSRTTARSVALTKEARTEVHKSERQHREGREDIHNRPQASTSKPPTPEENVEA